MDEEQIKKYWKLMNRLAYNSNFNAETINKIFEEERKETSLTRLSKRYLRFSIMAFILALTSIFYVQIPVFYSYMKIPLLLFLTLFFMTESCMDYYLYKKIKDINIFQMSTSEVYDRVVNCRKFHFICIAIMFPLSISLMVYLGFCFIDNENILAGMIFGAILGLGIGIKQLMDFLQDYKTII